MLRLLKREGNSSPDDDKLDEMILGLNPARLLRLQGCVVYIIL